MLRFLMGPSFLFSKLIEDKLISVASEVARFVNGLLLFAQKQSLLYFIIAVLSLFEVHAEHHLLTTSPLAAGGQPGSPRNGFTVSSSLGDGKLPLLHVDDSADDRCLVKEAIAITKAPFTYHEADGLESAMPFFHFHEHHGELEQRPALVLLDYELGGNTTGVDFLYWLRVRKKITSLPVVMFSGSPGRGHIAECYAAGVDHYLNKPNDFERLKRIVRTLYIELVSRPPGPIPHLKEYQPDPRGNAVKPEGA